jgi:hypothetical protein
MSLSIVFRFIQSEFFQPVLCVLGYFLHKYKRVFVIGIYVGSRYVTQLPSEKVSSHFFFNPCRLRLGQCCEVVEEGLLN